jgi:flagellar motor switch protein FliG
LDGRLMTNVDPNMRKAAVLLRSLDADTATMMLRQLSAEEAAAIRAAMRVVGPVESGEQADVVAELRRVRPAKRATNSGDVELALSSASASDASRDRDEFPGLTESTVTGSKRFHFLENAPTHALVPFLAREHAQTIAVVLSHLAPQRAAAVLAALPKKVQAETVERLSDLGETDPECVSVLVRELEEWVAKRDGSRAGNGRRRDTMAAILAAADAKSRGQILSSMKHQKAALKDQYAPRQTEHLRQKGEPRGARPSTKSHSASSKGDVVERQTRISVPQIEPTLPHVDFDDLIHFDSRSLAAVLRQVDANVLALALAGSREDLVDGICEQLPKRTAREFRRELRRLGPTRLSDVESAQQAVAQIAARQFAERRSSFAVSQA